MRLLPGFFILATIMVSHPGQPAFLTSDLLRWCKRSNLQGVLTPSSPTYHLATIVVSGPGRNLWDSF